MGDDTPHGGRPPSVWDRMSTPWRVLASIATVATFIIVVLIPAVSQMLEGNRAPSTYTPSSSRETASPAAGSTQSLGPTMTPAPSAPLLPETAAPPTAPPESASFPEPPERVSVEDAPEPPLPALPPITGKRNLTGEVMTEPPGALVVSGAEITSALDPRARREEYFAIVLEPGDTLILDGSPGNWDWGVATPSDLDSTLPTWRRIPELGDRWGWVAVEGGTYSIKAWDLGGETGSAYSYTISFQVRSRN
jgi:hypothetical protein